MARYSDEREKNLEVKYLAKIWSKVDRNVQLPESLTGDALLPLLDKVPTHRPVSRQIRFSPRFTWKSGATYAAAFVLVVALSAMLGRGRPQADLHQGDITPEPLPERSAPRTPGQPEEAAPANLMEEEAAEETAAPIPPQGTRPSDRSKPPAADPGKDTPADPGKDAPADPDVSQPVGGQGKSIPLGATGQYTYTYRINDDTDPDKAGFPITVNILHTSTGVLAFEMDLPGLLRIDEYFVLENTVAFLGPTSQGTVALHAYDITLLREPRTMGDFQQPGAFVAARLYKNVVSVATFAPAGTNPDCDVVYLPDSTGDDYCILSTIDLETMKTKRVAFAGASEEIQLYNLSAYLQYSGEETEENKHGKRIAHVRIDGMDIALRADPAEE